VNPVLDLTPAHGGRNQKSRLRPRRPGADHRRASSRLSRQPLSPTPIEALKHGVDLLLALSGLEIFQGLEPERLDGGGALKPPGPPLGHQLSRLLQVCSAALADQESQEWVFSPP
jgi:hypothetical protein